MIEAICESGLRDFDGEGKERESNEAGYFPFLAGRGKEKMEKLYEKLNRYGSSPFYPFHMPGHKRNERLLGDYFPVKEDITEITGFDNLHHAKGVILEAQKRAAMVYGVKESFFNINGSSVRFLLRSVPLYRKGAAAYGEKLS